MEIPSVKGSIVHSRSHEEFAKRIEGNWTLHIPSLVFAYNVMPHSTTGYQPYEFMFGHKAPSFVMLGWRLACYNEKASTNKCAWLNEQHELLMSANRQALKHIRQRAEKSQVRADGKTLHISNR